MSLYNIVKGFSPACVFFLPMLGRKSSEYPRFRDCFLSEDNHIVVLTRVGGPNRGCGYGEESLLQDALFVKTYDLKEDNTYGIYEFKVPDKWKSDFDKLVNGDLESTSEEYKKLIIDHYPKVGPILFPDEVGERVGM